MQWIPLFKYIPAIFRSRILRQRASAFRIGQFSIFVEKLRKKRYSFNVTDIRRAILFVMQTYSLDLNLTLLITAVKLVFCKIESVLSGFYVYKTAIMVFIIIFGLLKFTQELVPWTMKDAQSQNGNQHSKRIEAICSWVWIWEKNDPFNTNEKALECCFYDGVPTDGACFVVLLKFRFKRIPSALEFHW